MKIVYFTVLSGLLALAGCSGTRNLALAEAKAEIARMEERGSPDTVNASDLTILPAPVGRYLEKSGVVGKPRVRMFRARFSGRMKMGGENDSWRKVEGFQYNFFDSALTRIFFIRTRMFGLIRVTGRDKYAEGRGNMLIRAADKFTVADSRGPAMDRAALVTFLNDMMFFPSLMLSPKVTWEPESDTSARATLRDHGITVSGILYFNRDDDVVNFRTDDRTYDNGRGDVRKARWWTPLRSWQTAHGLRVPREGGAEWDFGDRRFAYADFEFQDIEYDSFNVP